MTDTIEDLIPDCENSGQSALGAAYFEAIYRDGDYWGTCPECGREVVIDNSSSEQDHAVATWTTHPADPMQPIYDEQDAIAAEEDRRFEQYRDDEIAARHG